MNPTQAHWQSAHIYYHEDDKDRLILDGVQPLFQQLRPTVPQMFFVRHWLRGPHLRLRFYTTAEQFATVVRPLLEDQIGRYLQAHPSRTVLDPEQVRPIYEHLAREEREPGPILPLYPNNSIQYLPYDRRIEALQSEVLAQMIEAFYVDSGALVFQLLEQIRSGKPRLTLALDQMVTLAHSLPGGLRNNFTSYRAHAEGFIMLAAAPEMLRAFFDQRAAAQGPAVAARVAMIRDALERDDPAVALLQEWASLVRRYYDQALALISAGQVTIKRDIRQDTPERMAELHDRLRYSPFHRQIVDHRDAGEIMAGRPTFQSYRLMLNLMYLHLNRLGIRPIDRYLLCHLVANGVEQVYGISSFELISRALKRIGAAQAA